MFTAKSLHHAYIIEGDKTQITPELFVTIETELGIIKQGNPDFFYEEFESFGIDDSRRLQSMQTYRGFSGAKKIFVVSTSSMTHEAQNALLKVFEEPTEGTHFFIITSSTERILPTLLSRVNVIKHSSIESNLENKDVDVLNFIESSRAGRFLIVKSILDSKDRFIAESFLKDILKYFHKKNNLNKISNSDILVLEDISHAISYIKDRSSSLKLLLEHIALMLPTQSK
jgi:DNA polymerase III delta prime subunit